MPLSLKLEQIALLSDYINITAPKVEPNATLVLSTCCNEVEGHKVSSRKKEKETKGNLESWRKYFMLVI